MFEPTVPKWVYDQKCTEYDKLLDKYHSLRATHAPTTPMRQSAPKADTGVQALQGAESAILHPRVRAMADKFMREDGMSEAAALREAKRLDDIARGRDVASSAVPTP